MKKIFYKSVCLLLALGLGSTLFACSKKGGDDEIKVPEKIDDVRQNDRVVEEVKDSDTYFIQNGASEYKILAVMILPLSKPVLATVALFIFLGKWNCWYEAMLYINDDKLVSLQYLLQRVMNNIKLLQDSSVSNMSNLLSADEIPSETVRMATAVLVAGPALFVFPFFQKYFVKGLTVGSVKG